MKKIHLGSKKIIDLLGSDATEFSLSPTSTLEFTELKPGVWVLVQLDSNPKEMNESLSSPKPGPVAEKIGIEEKILALVKQKGIAERVEGVFEGFLFKEELPVLHRLIQNGKIEKFKLSDKYKKPVYRLTEKKKESENPEAAQKEVEQYTLEKDGFLVVKNELRAKGISQELEQEIKEGKVRGIKSFDGFFYIADSSIIQKYTPRMLEFLQHAKTANAEIISKALSISPLLTRIICEFAKEDGLMIEKRKDLYSYIS